MIKTREQWEASKGFIPEPARETIEALRDVARDTIFASAPDHYNDVLYGVFRLEPEDIAKLKASLDALPPWLLEEEGDR